MDDVISPRAILPKAAARFGDKPALVTSTRTLTFSELNTESDRFAAALTARGVRPGDAVSLYAQNRWEWIVSYHGVLKAGAVVNPVNVMLTPEELAFVLRHCEAAAVCTSAEPAAGVVALRRGLPHLALVVAFGEAGDAPEGAAAFADLAAA